MPHIMIEMDNTRRSARKFERGYRQFERELVNLTIHVKGAKTNERPLVSRNKREGWYYAKLCGYKVQVGNESYREPTRYLRCHMKDLGLRYRKQSGAQFMRLKERK